VLAFENVTGDPSLDWMERGIAELLGSALLQSPALDVFDAQRIADLAANDRAPNPSSPSFSFLARHRIQRAIAGSILRSGGALRIQGRIVDTDGGRTVQSYAVEGPADSGLFNLVGRLVPDLQVGLEVNLTGNREAEGWLREITTTSVDAYRLYLSGHQALIGSRWREAAAAFEQALAIDSSFIAARTELSGAYWNLGTWRISGSRARPCSGCEAGPIIEASSASISWKPWSLEILHFSSARRQSWLGSIPRTASTPTCSDAAISRRNSTRAAWKPCARWSSNAMSGHTRMC
jgi:TolB-like protein